MWQSAYDFVFNEQNENEPVDYGPGKGPWQDNTPGQSWLPSQYSFRETEWSNPGNSSLMYDSDHYNPIVAPTGWDPYDIEGFDYSTDELGYGWYTNAELGSFSALVQHGDHDPNKDAGTFGLGFQGFQTDFNDPSKAAPSYSTQKWDPVTRTRTGRTKAIRPHDVSDIFVGEGFDPTSFTGYDADLANNLMANVTDKSSLPHSYAIAPTPGTSPAVPMGAGGFQWRDFWHPSQRGGGYDFVSYIAGEDGKPMDPNNKSEEGGWTMGMRDSGGYPRNNWHGVVRTPSSQSHWQPTDWRGSDVFGELSGTDKWHFDWAMGKQYGEKGPGVYHGYGNPQESWDYASQYGSLTSPMQAFEHNVGKDAFSLWRNANYGGNTWAKEIQSEFKAPDAWQEVPEEMWGDEGYMGWMAPDDPRNTTDDWEYQHPDNPRIDWSQPPPPPPGDPTGFSPIWQQRSNPISQNVFSYDPETAGYELSLDSGSYAYTNPSSTLNRYRNYSPYRHGTTSKLAGRSGPKKPYESQRITSEMVPWLPTPHHDDPGWFYGE